MGNFLQYKLACTTPTHQEMEILQQISAVKKAIDGLTRELIDIELDTHLEKEQQARIKKVIQHVIRL